MINLFKFIKICWRGFVGGPDFDNNINHRFTLEEKQLTIKVPYSNVVVGSNPDKVNFKHTSTRWFAKHAEMERQHSYVHMMAENWMYMPPIAFFPNSEYGMLSIELRIKQTNNINVLDKSALSRYVTQAYDDYHNGPDGVNTEIRQTTEERFSRSSCSWTQEEIEAEIAVIIELNGRPSLAPAIVKTFNQLDWVCYRETRNNDNSYRDYYCLPLSEQSFLEIEFIHQVDRPNKLKKWAKHALTSQERIIASIYLDDLPQTSSIEHSSVLESVDS